MKPIRRFCKRVRQSRLLLPLLLTALGFLVGSAVTNVTSDGDAPELNNYRPRLNGDHPDSLHGTLQGGFIGGGDSANTWKDLTEDSSASNLALEDILNSQSTKTKDSQNSDLTLEEILNSANSQVTPNPPTEPPPTSAPTIPSVPTSAPTKSTQLLPIAPTAANGATSVLKPYISFAAHTIGDTAGGIYNTDPRSYRVCTFSNLCVNGTHAILYSSDPAFVDEMREKFKRCQKDSSTERHPLCLCFTLTTTVSVVQRDDPVHRLGPVESGHHWLIDKYVYGHQIGHWTESLVFFHSIQQRRDTYDYPDIRRVIMQKTILPISEHEESIMKLSLSGLGPEAQTPIWQNELTTKDHTARCFERVSTSAITAKVATSKEDAEAFRMKAYEYFKFERKSCPPSKTVLLFREGKRSLRRMINEAEVEAIIARLGLWDYVKTTIHEGNSSATQAGLFASYGLMISSHSSQLINNLFAQKGAATIEVVPAFFNSDFQQLAREMDLHYQFGLGGNVPGIPIPDSVAKCHRYFSICRGRKADCLINKLNEYWSLCSNRNPDYDRYAHAVKHENFIADLDAIEASLKSAIDHLNQLCDGHWPGVRLPSVGDTQVE